VFSLARFLSRALPLLVVVAMMPAPVPAAAWANITPLNGEEFSGTATPNPSGCDMITGFTGTFDFTVSGTATGDYPGPFSETGTVTVSSTGSVTGFSASFTINANSGPQMGDTVSGTKIWAAPAGTLGVCSDAIALDVHSTYSAVISLPTGETFCDTGTALTNFKNPLLTSPFIESFSPDSAVANPIPTGGTCP
jgi:hypothetical protein